jgi:two-component system, OmpR family, sensor histidine kinase KdpD
VDRTAKAEERRSEFDGRAALVVYVASAPGSGKTRRILEDARRLAADGKCVLVGWIETKGRPDLERFAAALQRVPPRKVRVDSQVFEDFDYEAALRERPDVVVLDELAHDNLGNATHSKRWQDALALRAQGIGVIGAFNIQHLETIAPTAEALIGDPVREIIPLSFLQAADEVVALDVSPRLLQRRVKAGKIDAVFKEQTLSTLRELLLRTVDDLTLPVVAAERTPMAAAFVYRDVDPGPYLKRTAAIARALDLGLEVVPTQGVDRAALDRLSRELGAEMLHDDADPLIVPGDRLRASLVAVPAGKIGAKLANAPLPYDLFVVAATQTYLGENPARSPYSQTAGDRLRVGYGRLTVYFGAAPGAGKTYAMLDRAHQLKADGVDVVAGFVETHGRNETTALLEGLETVPERRVSIDGIAYREFDREALIARKPQVALIDELAHTNAPNSIAPKRFHDVLAVLRAGIDVITTLNVQHLEGLGETILRLTGSSVRETLPDGVLALADEVTLIDVTPETLRQRMREGKIYTPEPSEAALAGFFRIENLFALRELALRETLRARHRERIISPFERILLAIGSRPADLPMIARAGRIAARLEIEFAIAHVVSPHEKVDSAIAARLKAEARKTNVEWIEETAADPPQRLIELARKRSETTIALAGTLRPPRWLSRPSFARRMLDAGARELIILARPPETTESRS